MRPRRLSSCAGAPLAPPRSSPACARHGGRARQPEGLNDKYATMPTNEPYPFVYLASKSPLRQELLQ
ncbi:hypothetical protein AB3X93_43000, partial [Paraburkholderia sp. BR14262]